MKPILQSHLKSIWTILSFCCFLSTSAQTVTTLAGSTSGYADGIGTAAQFNGSAGVAIANDGTLYVADRVNNRIRKIMPDGTVTTFVGSTQGFADGIGTAALFNLPMFLDIDAAGNIYVADSGNHRIRKITPSGVVTTIAGSTSGFADGNVSTALFDYPEGIAVDATGIIYVADAVNQRIRKIGLDGVVTTLAGNGSFGYVDGVGSSAQFKTPSGIAIDASGNVYVSEKQNHCIRKITSTGFVSTLAGNGMSGFVNGTGSAARFSNPFGVTVDASGNVFVADANNNRIRKITDTGIVTTIAGSVQGYLDAVGTAAKFYYPIGVCISNDGTIFVGESGNSLVRKITTTLTSVNYELLNQIAIYPNPTLNQLNLDVGNLSVSKITLFDSNGRELQSKKIIGNMTTLFLEDLASGVYLLNINTDEGSFYKRIIKK